MLVSLLLALCGACADVPTGDPGPTPAISLTLIVGETLQVATITVATPADSTLPTEGVPVASADVNLEVVDDGAVAFPLVPTATPGRFEVVLAPGLGRSYTLQGTVLGRAVSFATDVPQQFDVVSLPNDTITPADTVPCRFSIGAQQACFPVVTESDQPMIVLCFVSPGQLPSPCAAADGFQLRVPSSPGARDVQIFGLPGDDRLRHAETVTLFASAILVRRTAVFP